jgi:hypothetical protein
MMMANTTYIRLSDQEKAGLLEIFDTELIKLGGKQVWLFGSRVDPTAKGGDMDLYIELNYILKDKLAFTRQLSIAIDNKLGERKVDILVKAPNIPDSALHEIAKQKGILLWHHPT